MGHPLPHPIYFTWAASLVTFFLVAAIDQRRIEVVETAAVNTGMRGQ